MDELTNNFNDLFDNIIKFPLDRKAKIKSRFEIFEIQASIRAKKEKDRKIKAREIHNDKALKSLKLGKYDPKKLNNNENNNS